MFAALSRLDGARQDQLHTGQIVSRSISDVNMIQGLLAMVPYLLGNTLLFFLSLIAMAFLSPLLTVVALAVGPALFALSLASRNKLFPASWDAQQHAANVAGVVDGAVTGVRVVKGFGQEQQEVERLEGAARLLYAARVRAVRLMARYNPSLQAIPALGQVGVLAFGGWLAIRGEINLGTFFAFSSYIAQLVGPVRALTGLITLGQEARASVIRVFEVIDSRPVLTEKPGAVDASARGIGRRTRRRHLRLPAVGARAARPVAAGQPRRDGRGGRDVRLGQVDHLAAAPPVLRRDRRRGADRRARRP